MLVFSYLWAFWMRNAGILDKLVGIDVNFSDFSFPDGCFRYLGRMNGGGK